jgi:hypothetical protein
VCRIRLMAAQALRVLFECGRQRFGTEVDHARQRSATRLHVSTPRSVTGLALQSAVAERSIGIAGLCVLGAEQARDGGVVVTCEAGIGSLWTVLRTGVGDSTQQQSESGCHAGTWKPPHSIRRSGDVVHYLHIRNSAGTMADAAGLYACRTGTENRAAFGVFRDRR